VPRRNKREVFVMTKGHRAVGGAIHKDISVPVVADIMVNILFCSF